MLDDIADLLADTEEQLVLVQAIYDESAKTGQQSRRLKPRIKNVLENQRSILDYLAHHIHDRFGSAAKTKIYYPLAFKPETFESDCDNRMPGVRKARPDVAKVIERYQPYDQEWITWLSDLTNENKHRILSKHTRRADTRTDIHLPGGGTASTQGIEYQDAQGNEISPAEYFGHPTTDVPVIEWDFAKPPLPATLVLISIQSGIKALVADVSQVAGL